MKGYLDIIAESKHEMESYLKENQVTSVERKDDTEADYYHSGKKPCLNSNDDSGIVDDENTELIKKLREELNQARQDKEDQAKFFAQEMATQEVKLNRALRGNTCRGEYGAERTLLLLDQKLKGKKIVSEEEFNKYKEWEQKRRVEESTSNILKESEAGLVKITEEYKEI